MWKNVFVPASSGSPATVHSSFVELGVEKKHQVARSGWHRAEQAVFPQSTPA